MFALTEGLIKKVAEIFQLPFLGYLKDIRSMTHPG